MTADEIGLLGEQFQVGARRQGIEGKVDTTGATGQLPLDRRDFSVQERLNRGGDFLAVLARQFKCRARFGIGIAGASECDQRNSTWMFTLEIFGGISGPIAADLVEIPAQRGAM